MSLRLGYATHVELEQVLPVTCYAQCEQIRFVSAERLIRHGGTVDGVDVIQIENVLRRIFQL